jgi:hypothetical protein
MSTKKRLNKVIPTIPKASSFIIKSMECMYVFTKDVALLNLYKTQRQLATTHVSPNV